MSGTATGVGGGTSSGTGIGTGGHGPFSEGSQFAELGELVCSGAPSGLQAGSRCANQGVVGGPSSGPPLSGQKFISRGGVVGP